MEYISYLVEMILCSGLLLGIYWLFLRNRPFHNFNRAFLLMSFVVSTLIPSVRLNVPDIDIIYSERVITRLQTAIEPNSFISTLNTYVLGIFVLISFLFFVFVIRSIWMLKRLRQQHSIVKMKGYNLIKTELAQAPFSFLNDLFWHTDLSIDSEDGNRIFRHELAHIEQKHTYDVIFTRIVCGIFWINPFFWIAQKELVCVHEFLADECAIGSNDSGSLAAMLLAGYRKHTNQTVHYFFSTPLIRRLNMVTNTKRRTYWPVNKALSLSLMITIVYLLGCNSKETLSKHESSPPSFADENSLSIEPEINESSLKRTDGDVGEIQVDLGGIKKPYKLEIKNGKMHLSPR